MAEMGDLVSEPWQDEDGSWACGRYGCPGHAYGPPFPGCIVAGRGGELRRQDAPLPELDAWVEAVAASVGFMRGLLTYTHKHPQAAEQLRAALDKVAPGWRDA